MRRREFIGMATNVFLLSWLDLLGTVGEDAEGGDYGVTALSNAHLDRLGGLGLQELLEFHRDHLRNVYVPLWEGNGVDWERGGFFDRLDRDGTPYRDEKRMYYQGRALWVFSYFYNHVSGKERHLQAARQGRDFLVKHALDENGYWISRMSPEGKRLSASTDIYGDMYMLMGLTELYRAARREEDLELAIRSAYTINERIVSPHYQHLNGHGRSNEPGTKRLGTWQHFLSTLTPLLKVRRVEGVERIARICVRNILERHCRPELGVCFELLDDRFQPFPPDPLQNNRQISGWHSIQAAWMVMDEALRLGHRRIFRQAMEVGISTLERCYAEGIGLTGLPHPEADPADDPEQASWGALDDALVFCLLTLEHTQEPWAIRYYNSVFELHNSRPDKWRLSDLLHHPRRLFYSINILERMIRRNGRVSNFLET